MEHNEDVKKDMKKMVVDALKDIGIEFARIVGKKIVEVTEDIKSK